VLSNECGTGGGKRHGGDDTEVESGSDRGSDLEGFVVSDGEPLEDGEGSESDTTAVDKEVGSPQLAGCVAMHQRVMKKRKRYCVSSSSDEDKKGHSDRSGRRRKVERGSKERLTGTEVRKGSKKAKRAVMLEPRVKKLLERARVLLEVVVETLEGAEDSASTL
jgi:hypothetical protein